MVLNRYCPAVSHIWNLTTLPSTIIDLLLWVGLLESEIDSDSGKVCFLETLLCESAKKGRFSDWAITDEDNFEEMVVLFDHCYRVFIRL